MWIIRAKQLMKIIILGAIFVALCFWGGYYFMAFVLACLAYGLIEPYRIENKETYYIDYKIPEAFEDFKILFVSDIHHGVVYSKKRVKTLVRLVNSHKPDSVFCKASDMCNLFEKKSIIHSQGYNYIKG